MLLLGNNNGAAVLMSAMTFDTELTIRDREIVFLQLVLVRKGEGRRNERLADGGV